MNPETRVCQNCKQGFIIEPEDFDFYEKIKVPPPTWCSDCKLTRRMSWRNERTLYKRRDIFGKELISIYSPDKPFKIFEQKYWWGDDWSPLDYGRAYNFSETFFKQFRRLLDEVPVISLININAVNSDYCNSAVGNKNCYLSFGGDFCENVSYNTLSQHCKDSFDLYWANKSELCYELSDSENGYKLFFSRYCQSCNNSAFLYNCRNCSECFGCVNLRNKSNCIFNEQYTKEEYEKKLKDLSDGSFGTLQKIKAKFSDFEKQAVHRFAVMVNSQNVTGNNVYNTKNCQNCFDVLDGAQDCKNLLITAAGVKDCREVNHIGLGSELCYESCMIFPVFRALCSAIVMNSTNISYSYNCHNSNNLFACIGLRNKQYCILNKQYTKEEYEALVPKIIEHMNQMPYVDKQGRTYRYGEFFPPELSPFCYNETIAQEYFPLTKEQAIEQGYSWKDPEPRNYQIDIKTDQLPDNIRDVKDDIIGKVIECSHQGQCNEQCTEAFRIIEPELQFYRRMNLPLPRLCPNCRHYGRLKQRNPLKLWTRQCMCQGQTPRGQTPGQAYQNTSSHQHGDNPCPNTFQTSYAPDRPEIVYCEQCYLKEVV